MPPVSRKSRLLWAAREHFSQFGSRGARIDGILETAQVNKRHLYDIFLTKEGLYMAVLSEVSREIDAAFTAESVRWPREIDAMYTAFCEFLSAHRDFVLLHHWEELSPTLNGPRIQETMASLWEKFETLVRGILGTTPDDEAFRHAATQARLWCKLRVVDSAIASLKQSRDDDTADAEDSVAHATTTTPNAETITAEQKIIYAQIAQEIRKCFNDIPSVSRYHAINTKEKR